MVIFIGTQESGFFLKETIKEEIIYSGTIDISRFKEIALSSDFTGIIVDLSQWRYLNSDLIAETINDVAAAMRSKIIILAIGFDINSKLCTSLISYGIKNIITAGNLTDIKSDFLDYYNADGTEVITKVQSKILEKEIQQTSAKTIAVVGSQERIGTTTQCFQIVKYLASKGYKTAYLEFNNTDYLKKMKKLFSISDNIFTFEGINLFNAEQIKYVLKEYDYIIYDYGSTLAPNFNKYSFLEKDICIAVCGAKPNEIEYSTKILGLFQNNSNVIYLFNFVSDNDKNDIKKLMGNHSTYFSSLIPDAYTVLLQQQILYDQVISPSELCDIKPDKKKFSLFRRKKNG